MLAVWGVWMCEEGDWAPGGETISLTHFLDALQLQRGRGLRKQEEGWAGACVSAGRREGTLAPEPGEACCFFTYQFATIQPDEGQTPAGPCLEGLCPVSATPFAAGLRGSGGPQIAWRSWGGGDY